MKDSSLEQAQILILEALSNTNRIDHIDKLELAINIQHFLDPKKYRENVKVLNKRRKK